MGYEHLTNEANATKYLSDQLWKGTLVLFLGAGTSMGAGLPNWIDLVKRIRSKVGLTSDKIKKNSSADTLQIAADEVRNALNNDNKEFARLVKNELYRGVSLTNDLLHNDLLIAIGALLMGSRRGRVNRVVTLNFDCVLEWYVSLYGFQPKHILQPPVLEGAEDVRIYHPHGFLSHPDLAWRDSDFVVLGLDVINERLGKTGDRWFELMRHLLRTGVVLFVGVSPRTFDDRALAPLLVNVGPELAEERPTGFWILRQDDPELLEPEARDALKKRFLSHNVVPIFLPTKDAIPNFMLDLCRHAVERVSG